MEKMVTFQYSFKSGKVTAQRLSRLFFVSSLTFLFLYSPMLCFSANPTYETDQQIDEKYGFFDLVVSSFQNMLRIRSTTDQPSQVQSGGFPPYDQEKELASVTGPTSSENRTCFINQQQQLVC